MEPTQPNYIASLEDYKADINEPSRFSSTQEKLLNYNRANEVAQDIEFFELLSLWYLRHIDHNQDYCSFLEDLYTCKKNFALCVLRKFNLACMLDFVENNTATDTVQ